jgi:hypothetical protein
VTRIPAGILRRSHDPMKSAELRTGAVEPRLPCPGTRTSAGHDEAVTAGVRVTFVDGPLDGEVRELQDVDLVDGSVLQLPSGLDDDAAVPGDESVISYMYEGEGVARYIAGIGAG